MLTANARWLSLVAMNTVALGVLGFYSTSGAAPQGGGQPPFNNAVDQRDAMVRELREIKDLLKEQNAMLRAGGSKPAAAAGR